MTIHEPPWLRDLLNAGFTLVPVPALGRTGLLAFRSADGYTDTVHVWSPDAALAARVPDSLLDHLFSVTAAAWHDLGPTAAVVATTLSLPRSGTEDLPASNKIRNATVVDEQLSMQDTVRFPRTIRWPDEDPDCEPVR